MLMLRLLLRWNWEQQQVVAQRPGRGRHQPFRSAIAISRFAPPSAAGFCHVSLDRM
jgi:hypothetical protein